MTEQPDEYEPPEYDGYFILHTHGTDLASDDIEGHAFGPFPPPLAIAETVAAAYDCECNKLIVGAWFPKGIMMAFDVPSYETIARVLDGDAVARGKDKLN